MHYVCKMCGRSIKTDEQPRFCYFDRMDSIENISDEDALKMGLTQRDGIEFLGDVRYDPFNGRPISVEKGLTLQDFQREVLSRVVTE